jgi:hypothetical protein
MHISEKSQTFRPSGGISAPMATTAADSTDWPATARAVKEAANFECQICGAAERAWGFYDRAGYFHEIDPAPLVALGIKPPADILTTEGIRHIIRVALVVAHADDLAALCRRCHLILFVRRRALLRHIEMGTPDLFNVPVQPDLFDIPA